MLCLDTNVVIGILKGAPAHLMQRVDQEMRLGRLGLPVMVLFELQYGVAKSSRPQENAAWLATFLSLPIMVLTFEAEDAAEADDIRAALRRAGTPIGPYDVLIAGQARRRGAVLVTANVSEFSRVPGLRVENWATP